MPRRREVCGLSFERGSRTSSVTAISGHSRSSPAPGTCSRPSVSGSPSPTSSGRWASRALHRRRRPSRHLLRHAVQRDAVDLPPGDYAGTALGPHERRGSPHVLGAAGGRTCARRRARCRDRPSPDALLLGGSCNALLPAARRALDSKAAGDAGDGARALACPGRRAGSGAASAGCLSFRRWRPFGGRSTSRCARSRS
jgi:hypothetical protein